MIANFGSPPGLRIGTCSSDIFAGKFEVFREFIDRQRIKIAAAFTQMRKQVPLVTDGVLGPDVLREVRAQLIAQLPNTSQSQHFLAFFDQQMSRRVLSIEYAPCASTVS